MKHQYPPYINRSADYNSGLPYSFIGARYYNFLLKGDMDKLQNLCDVYINRPSGFNVTVKPLVPYVIVTFADYPKAYSQALDPSIYGFMQYQEAVFTVVLQTEKGICGMGGESVSFIPYLFLDNPRAIAAGREVFSLPKVHGTVNIPDPGYDEPKVFNCALMTLPNFSPTTQARNMEIVRVVAQRGFHAEGSEVGKGDIMSQIDSHVYSSFGSDAGVTQAQSSAITRSSQLKFINLRQFRSFPDTQRAAQKAIFDYQATNVNIARGGVLRGKFEMSFPENSALFPIVESLGLIPRIISAFWYDWTFQFHLGEDLWNSGGKGMLRKG